MEHFGSGGAEHGLSIALERLRDDTSAGTAEAVQAMLAAVRMHLGLGVVFLTECSGDRRKILFVDATDGSAAAALAGRSDLLEETYCQRVVDGRLPPVINDTAANPAAKDLPITHELGIGSHLGVPVRFSDGRLYGTFCCYDPKPNPTLNERDVALMRALAALLAGRIERDVLERERIELQRSGVRRLLDERALHVVLQPIVSLHGRNVVGHEALARFGVPGRAPDAWFREARQAGLGLELEWAAMQLALERLADCPAGTYLAVNVSPEALVAEGTFAVLTAFPLDRVVVELTEHAAVSDYVALLVATTRLQKAGARIAVDDAGAGFASLTHILRLQPDLIKLDTGLTCCVSRDLARQALVEALVFFSRRCGSCLVAEGVENEQDAMKLLELGVEYAQGFHLGRPRREFAGGGPAGASDAAGPRSRFP